MMPDRRTFLARAGLAALAIGSASTLAGCSSSGSGTGSTSGSTAPGTGVRVPIDDVPLDGGLILTDAQFVVTQPSAGTFKAFSSTCTHQSCTVGAISNREIICPCHDSRFSIDNGSVITGPASNPLPEATVAVDGETLTIS